VKDLPPSYYRELPKLMDGPLAGYPRVYGIAWAVVAHSDSTIDARARKRGKHDLHPARPLANAPGAPTV